MAIRCFKRISKTSKYRWMIPLFLAVLIIGIVLCSLLFANRPPLQTVATVNGCPITVREVQTRFTDGRGYVRNYFETKYNVVKEDASFWDMKFDGITPMEYGRKYYLDASVRIKVIQILGKEMGLVEDISYDSFLTRLEAENERRSQAVANGQPVYGLLQYSETDYFEKEFSSLEESLFDKLVEEDMLPVTEQEMLAYYNENRYGLFKNTDSYTYEVVTAAISPTSEDGDDPAAKAAIEVFAERLKNGESFEQLVQEVESGKIDGLTYTLVTVDPEKEVDLLNYEKILSLQQVANTKELKLNEVSGILTSPYYYYSIGRYTEFQDNGYAEFEEDAVQSSILYYLQLEKYQQYIDQKVETAAVETDSEVFSQIEIPNEYR